MHVGTVHRMIGAIDFGSNRLNANNRFLQASMLGGWRFLKQRCELEDNLLRHLIGELCVAAGCAGSQLPDAANKFRLGVCAWGPYSRASPTACAYVARCFDMFAASPLYHR